MRIRALAIACLLAAASSRAATPAPAAPATEPTGKPDSDGRVVRVFEIRYRDVQDVSLILPTLLSDTNVLTVDRASRTVTVVDRPEFVQRVAEFLQQFDLPPHAVVVRIVLEKAERPAPPAGAEGLARETSAWTYRPLAETALEVLERGQATQVVGPDGAFEIHVALASVDEERKLMRFDEIKVSRLEPAGDAPGAAPTKRELFKTAVDLQDRVGKVVMAAHEETADVALVVRVLGLIREEKVAR